ncbi:hypothetical protein FQR65_LT04459 [Abscondita terminalis]|nr:hypothetical protein FQR65_LT04459 [Abscondita terminalis]
MIINNEEYTVEEFEANEEQRNIEDVEKLTVTENKIAHVSDAEEIKKRNRSTDDDETKSSKEAAPKRKNYLQNMFTPIKEEKVQKEEEALSQENCNWIEGKEDFVSKLNKINTAGKDIRMEWRQVAGCINAAAVEYVKQKGRTLKREWYDDHCQEALRG